MRQETITIYKFDELSDEAKKRACEKYRAKYQDIHWQEEIFDSLKSLFDVCNGVKLKNYELGLNCYSFLTVEFDQHEAANLSGPRAMAWLENNLLSRLRLSWTGPDRQRCRKWGYKPGEIPPCPFTGYCADDDYLDCLIKEVRAGFTLRESFSSLATAYQTMLQDESDAQSTDEYIGEHLTINDYEFTDDGERY